MASTRQVTSTTPALLTKLDSGPSLASILSNMAITWDSTATSACTVMAVPPAARIWRTTSSAASELLL